MGAWQVEACFIYVCWIELVTVNFEISVESDRGKSFTGIIQGEQPYRKDSMATFALTRTVNISFPDSHCTCFVMPS